MSFKIAFLLSNLSIKYDKIVSGLTGTPLCVFLFFAGGVGGA